MIFSTLVYYKAKNFLLPIQIFNDQSLKPGECDFAGVVVRFFKFCSARDGYFLEGTVFRERAEQLLYDIK